jgi:putative colanic acid biosynthesis UDP-glucose lipid carrier transferase
LILIYYGHNKPYYYILYNCVYLFYEYKFDFLYEGTYDIWVIGDCDYCPWDQTYVLKTIEVTSKKQDVVVEDFVISLVLVVLLSPLYLFLAVMVKLSSPGPVIYRQKRVGWNGEHFDILKFRSMPVNTEKEGVVWGNSAQKTENRFCRWMRKTSLDELPQFFNVLRGDMSIVGPRPERPEFVEKFKDEIPGYMKKHLVKAGITGWAQIHGWRGDTDLKARIEHDLFYIDNWSLMLDLKIIFYTPWRGLINKNAY